MIQTIKKKWKLFSVAGIGIILAGSIGWWYTQGSETSANQQTATIHVSRGPIKVTISGTGSIQPAVTKSIVSKVNGPISAINVKNGQEVTEGTLLFQINSESAKNEIKKAELELKQAKLDYNALVQQSTQQSTTAPTLGQNPNTPNPAAPTTTRTSSTSTSKESQKIKIDLAQLNLDTLKKQLANYKIYAPVDGIVNLSSSQSQGLKSSGSSSGLTSSTSTSSSSSSTDNPWQVGDQVSSNTALATMIGDAGMNVTISVDEVDIAKVKVGQKVMITADAIPDSTFTGTVQEIATEGTQSNGVASFDVKVSVAKPVGLKIGMTANVEINVATKENALLLPIEAVQERGNRKFVMLPSTDSDVTNSDRQAGNQGSGNQAGADSQSNSSTMKGENLRGSANMKPVETGLYNESLIEITSGLQEGDTVVIPTVARSTNNANRTAMPFGGGGMNRSGGR